MKKFLLLAILGIFSIGFAEPFTVSDYSAASGLTLTADITAVSGRQIKILGIIGTSDLAGSIITVQQGATTGTTSNYTTIGTIIVGAATYTQVNDKFPLIVFPTNRQARFQLNSTTANTLFITYDK